MVEYSIVIPAYNEEGNIEGLVKDIVEKCRGDFDVIIVDDNSTDGTAGICDRLSTSGKVSCIHRKKGDNGMGHALVEGTKKARGEYIVWVMGDRSDRIETVNDMVEKLRDGCDMVMGSRYMPGGSSGELSPDKALYSSGYTALTRLIFGIPAHDITNAFRGFKKSVFEGVKPESGDFAISPEFAIKAQMRGYRISEVPTTYFDRRAGQPKFKLFEMGLRYFGLFKLRLTYRK